MTEEKERKKRVMADIIKLLHQGLSFDEAKARFEKEIGEISSLEIAELEQSLIAEGLPPEEIKKFCNVHALLFESSLAKELSAKQESAAHPVSLFQAENREIEKITARLKELASSRKRPDLDSWKSGVKRELDQLKGIDLHYTRKEQLLFPYLEKHGFPGPSKVMWGKDNDIRSLLKAAAEKLTGVKTAEQIDGYAEKDLQPLIEEVEGMIFKEEKILFPTSLEKLSVAEWVEILKESSEVGYAYIEKPRDIAPLIEELKRTTAQEIGLSSKELMWLMNTLPLDLTFVDKNDEVRYFTEGRDRIFVRTKSVIGRKVHNCHPPQSVDKVEKILSDFKTGKRDAAEFWINYRGKLVYIRYFAVRDENHNYLGTLEITEDITGIKKLAGEKRLESEKD